MPKPTVKKKLFCKKMCFGPTFDRKCDEESRKGEEGVMQLCEEMMRRDEKGRRERGGGSSIVMRWTWHECRIVDIVYFGFE